MQINAHSGLCSLVLCSLRSCPFGQLIVGMPVDGAAKSVCACLVTMQQ